MYRVSHGQFLLRLYPDAEKSLFIWCKACSRVCFDSHWTDSRVSLSRHPDGGWLLNDRDHLAIRCQAVFAAEVSGHDVDFPALPTNET